MTVRRPTEHQRCTSQMTVSQTVPLTARRPAAAAAAAAAEGDDKEDEVVSIDSILGMLAVVVFLLLIVKKAQDRVVWRGIVGTMCSSTY